LTGKRSLSEDEAKEVIGAEALQRRPKSDSLHSHIREDIKGVQSRHKTGRGRTRKFVRSYEHSKIIGRDDIHCWVIFNRFRRKEGSYGEA